MGGLVFLNGCESIDSVMAPERDKLFLHGSPLANHEADFNILQAVAFGGTCHIMVYGKSRRRNFASPSYSNILLDNRTVVG